MKREMYKTSLKTKTVDELVEIILRKDDKEKEKNKQISFLERKICSLKYSIKELTKDADSFNKRYQDIATEAHNSEINRQHFASKYDKVLARNAFLRILIALVGVVAIIELLIILV